MERRRGGHVIAVALVVVAGTTACSIGTSDKRPPDDGRQRVDDARHRVDGGNQDLAPHGNMTLSVDCPEGEVATSGGTWSNYPDVTVTWTDVTDSDTYAAAFLNTTGDSRRVGVYVMCEEQ